MMKNQEDSLTERNKEIEQEQTEDENNNKMKTSDIK